VRNSKVSVEDMLQDPCWFLDDMSTRDGSFSLVKVSEPELSALPFLAQNWDRSHLSKVRLSAETVLTHLGQPDVKPSPNFIWHTGFCCSTLLTRALHMPQGNTTLREPQVLLILAELKRYNYFSNGRLNPRLMAAAFSLLSRPFSPGARVTLKPANVAGFLVPDAARLTSGRMLFLYSDCRSFLISVAKRGENGMRFARRGFGIIAGDGNEAFQWPMHEVMELSDLRVAALMWHMQIGEFLRNIPSLPSDRVASLDCDALLADPAGVLGKLDEFLGLGLPEGHVCRTIDTVLRHDAKSPDMPYDAARRRAEYARIAEIWGEDLDEIVAWSYEVCPKTPRGVPLPNTVATIEKSYHP
jgi:hypothetical protein